MKQNASKKVTPKKAASKKPARKSFWTANRIQRLVMWHDRYMQKGSKNIYTDVAKHLNCTKSAAYHKLGHLGRVQANWANRYLDK